MSAKETMIAVNASIIRRRIKEKDLRIRFLYEMFEDGSSVKNFEN